jgi:hypothetical protein
MKRIAFVVSWFYKIFTPTTILVTIFHICHCDDVTLVNEKSIVSWKYMKSNKICVFNVNFQYSHKQVPSAYFSMMLNIHKHISHICVGTWVWRVWNLQSKNNFKVDFASAAISYWPFSFVIDRNRNRPFNLIQNKVGYCSCFATGVKLEQFLWNSFIKIVHWVRRGFF